MFQDIELSKTLMEEYKESGETSADVSAHECFFVDSFFYLRYYHLLLKGDGSIELCVMMLTSGFWPIPQIAPKCILPQVVFNAFDKFKRQGLQKYLFLLNNVHYKVNV